MNRVTYRAGSEVSQGLLISSSLTVLPLPVEFVPSPSSVRSSVIRRIRAMICRDLFNETKRRNDSFMRTWLPPPLPLCFLGVRCCCCCCSCCCRRNANKLSWLSGRDAHREERTHRQSPLPGTDAHYNLWII